MSFATGSRIGPYEIVGKLGAGAMGEVWRARDTRLSREVALKVLPASLALDGERLARFEREAQVLASLNHPSIAAIYGVEESHGQTALVLELVEGPTLDERIAQGALSLDDAVAIARQIAEGLEYAHDRGVVHRDLKPANVKLAPDGRVKVLDFGLAKAIAADSSGRSDSAISPTITSLGTVAGVILGTAAYMAPEQARGANVDRRADIWSFGVVLWEMLTGKRLFDDATVSDTLAAVLRAPIEWNTLPASVPPALVRLLKRCLDRDPKKRLRDIGEARIALETLVSEPEVAPAAAAIAPAPKRSIAATIAWAAALAIVAISAMATVGYLRAPAPDKRVMRFHVAQDTPGQMTWPRLSPDGTMISFQARGENGQTSIWVRRLDSFEGQQLPGTEGAARQWWSPDSRYIAFFAGSQLKKISPSGGPAQLICDGSSGADGTWGAGGTILFDGRAVDPIQRVDAAGGKATQATTPDAAKGDVGHAWPFFLPDGKHFLFLGMPNQPGAKAQIKVTALGETTPKTLTASNSRVEYADGHLLYVLDGTLVAHRFDPDKLELSGDPIPIAANLGVDANGASPFSTSSTGALAYFAGVSGVDSSLVWVDRTGRELGTLGETGQYRDVSISPDGTRVAYGFSDPRSGTEDIWVRDLRRDVASRLTFGAGNEVWPEWSPDGTRIAFAADAEGRFSVYEKAADGVGAERLVYKDAEGQVGATDWSSDGKWLAVDVVPTARRIQIKLLSLDGERKLVDYAVADVNQTGGQFSPDGRFMAYSSNESGVREIYVQTVPIGAGKWQISSGGGGETVWRADGKELLFRTLNNDFYAVPVTTSPRFELGIPKLIFRRAVNRTTVASARNRWSVTPDGQRFLINASRETAGIPCSVVLNWAATMTN